MTEDEAKAVAEFAARYVGDAMHHLAPIIRYGRLFTPAADASGPDRTLEPWRGRGASRLAMGSGLLYAEGYARLSVGIATDWAWCLDGEAVVERGSRVPFTAYFGVALQPDYVRRVRAARQRYRAGDDGFTWVFQPRHEAINPPLDPGTDVAGGLGRDIPSWVRQWALTAELRPGDHLAAEAWLLEELLGSPGVRAPRPPAPAPAPPGGQRAQDPGTVPPGAYARYLLRRVDGPGSGMALVCNGQSGDVYSEDAAILDELVQDSDSLDTLLRIADQHRARCEWAKSPGGVDEHPEPAVCKPAEAHLKWANGPRAGYSFAVLHRLDYNVWDAWRQPPPRSGQTAAGALPVRLTRNGDSYEMALAAVFRAMGEEMPEEFSVVHPPFELPAGQSAPSEGPLPMSYARYLIRADESRVPSRMQLWCSGQTGGSHSWQSGGPFEAVEDGSSLAALIRMADAHRRGCEWAVCRASEREHPEYTVEGRAQVRLKWLNQRYGEDFAVLRHLDYDVWDAWQPWDAEQQTATENTSVRLTRKDVNYETALMTVFRAMGDKMPDEFTLTYL
ncbi:MAG TPA: hypothetical protein VGD91_03120 [Trebonia sp.]